MTTWIDHLLVSVRDLDTAATRWAAAGLEPNGGGRHAAGTENRLIRGPRRCYLELIDAPADVDDPLANVIRATRGPLSWAIGVDDVAAARASLAEQGFPVGDMSDGSRAAPDGARFSWRVCGTMGPLLHPWAPFLIEWTSGMSAGPADGSVVRRVGVEAPDPDLLSRLLLACGLDVVADSGQHESSRRLSDGEVDLVVRRGDSGLVSVGFSKGVEGPTTLDGLQVE